MNSKNGSANPMLVLMLLASVVLNVAFVSGCETIEEFFKSEPPEIGAEYRDNPEHVKSVAEKLGVRVSGTDTAGDIERNIRERIGEAEQPPMPAPLSDESIERLRNYLKPDERAILDKYQKAIKDAQGKRVLYLPVDGE
jgi:hypothetical protein